MKTVALILSIFLIPSGAQLFRQQHSLGSCKAVLPPTNFELEKYVEKTWYVQRQQINTYQPANDFFCVTATYDMEGKTSWGKKAVTVRNVADTNAVNNGRGPQRNLCATRKNPDTAPGKLTVAPCFVPPAFGGDYWVVAFAPDYSWAIITGGQPKMAGACSGEGADFCTTPSEAVKGMGRYNGQGLWFFSRVPVADESVLEEMEAAAAAAGICTANMKKVVQEGCKYEGRKIKN